MQLHNDYKSNHVLSHKLKNIEFKQIDCSKHKNTTKKLLSSKIVIRKSFHYICTLKKIFFHGEQ